MSVTEDLAATTRKIKDLSGKIEYWRNLSENAASREEMERRFAEFGRQMADANEELLARMDKISTGDEMRAAGGSPRFVDRHEADHRQAFDCFLREGVQPGNLAADYAQRPEYRELRNLTESTSTEGGYLVPEGTWERSILKDVVDSDGALLADARHVEITKGNCYKLPRRTSQPTAYWIGESSPDSITESSSEYGTQDIYVHNIAAKTKISIELLQDANYDLENEIRADVVEQFQVTIADAVLEGNNVHKPEGVLVNAEVLAATLTGEDNVNHLITADDMIRMYANLKARYRNSAVWYFNDTMLSKILRLETTAGNYVWNTFSGSPQGTILGRPWRAAVADLDSDGTLNNIPLIFADMSRAYRHVTRKGLIVVRDNVTYKPSDVEFAFMLRVGGAVVQSEGIQIITCG